MCGSAAISLCRKGKTKLEGVAKEGRDEGREVKTTAMDDTNYLIRIEVRCTEFIYSLPTATTSPYSKPLAAFCPGSAVCSNNLIIINAPNLNFILCLIRQNPYIFPRVNPRSGTPPQPFPRHPCPAVPASAASYQDAISHAHFSVPWLVQSSPRPQSQPHHS